MWYKTIIIVFKGDVGHPIGRETKYQDMHMTVDAGSITITAGNDILVFPMDRIYLISATKESDNAF